ncbi:MAG: phytanoyl-CoA dioxygenase [Opitutaceae bacterium]|nr:phytanoyl-CoA dioxygenase [Opitutaceae bacterium]
MLSKRQIEIYHRDGFIGVENVLNEVEIEELCRVTDEFVEKSRSVTETDAVFDLEPGHTAEEPKLRRLKSPIKVHDVYLRTLNHEKILDIVAQLIGPSIWSNGNKLNMKAGGFGSPVEWHQDWAWYPFTNDDLLAVGVCMDDMSEENGCLLAIPGSHKGRILDHHLNGVFAGGVTEPNFNDSAVKKIELKAGGISIHHVRTLHGSLPNLSPNPRRLLLYQYCASDAWPLGGVDWDEYASRHVRGDPTNQPRLVEVPIRMPVPKSGLDGSIYETQSTMEKSTFRSSTIDFRD